MGEEVTEKKYINKRQKLSEILPLEMPFQIGIAPNNLCNFQCFYCVNSLEEERRRKNGIVMNSMSFENYKLCIDNIQKEGHLKVLTLAGMGEPLLHPQIVEMVQYAKEKNVADCVRIITNGSLLSQKMSDGLIEAGLDNLKISLQGIDEEAYWKNAHVKIDYEQYLHNIEYFKRNKKQTIISVKIMDVMVQQKGEKEKFIELFKNICDEYMIENLSDNVDDVECEDKGLDLNKALYGDVIDSDICSTPFYRAFIDSDCQLMPCCHIPRPQKFGDVRKGFKKAWKSQEYINFLIRMLKERKKIPVCNTCMVYRSILTEKEFLDDSIDELIKKYRMLLEDEK